MATQSLPPPPTIPTENNQEYSPPEGTVENRIPVEIGAKKKGLTRIYRDKLEGFAPMACRDNFLEPNPLLVGTIPYKLTFDEQSGDSTAVIPLNGTINRSMTNDKSGVISVLNLLGSATSSSYLVNIYDQQFQQYLANRALHAETIIGTAEYPYELPEELYIGRTQQLRVELTDLSGALNTIRFSFEGRKYYFAIEDIVFNRMSSANTISRPYFYTTDNDVALTAGTDIQTAYTTMVANADFMLYKTTIKTSGLCRIKITNMNTGYAYSNSWVLSTLFAGSSLHHEVLEPMLFQRKTQLRFDFINMSGAPNNVYITMAGMNYYYDR